MAVFLLFGGRVQGVGFRPFVYRVARRHGVRGWVRNVTGRVEILAEGDGDALDAFERELLNGAPPLSQPAILEKREVTAENLAGFAILDSGEGPADIHVPPDHFMCADCGRELFDPRDRRHRYPFINCTQCGPRYTLIARLPYDRADTTMARFSLCETCRAEYQDPLDRRFHAEPVACAVCGPRLRWRDRFDEEALAQCVGALRDGLVVAVKGVGGYHLMCDARSESAVTRLRARKPRPQKPLAVLFPSLDDAERELDPGTAERAALTDPTRPIVLVQKRPISSLAAAIAPGLSAVGAMLPYSPLHALLARDFGGPLVATSGNVSGEPVLIDPGEAESRLGQVADAFLHHDRPILRPADDSVVRVIAGQARPLRVGRGYAPMEMELPFAVAKPTLAVGGHMKNTVALAWDNRVVVSPHIGDMGTVRSLAVFDQVVGDLQTLYRVRPERVACDAHPGYTTHRWAKKSGMPVIEVLHHHAHASALAAEFPGVARWLVFTWDGVGYGEDGTLWGGESLFGAPGAWRRVASLRPFFLPGGEKAGREPWRSAAAVVWETGGTWDGLPGNALMAREAWSRRMNCPQTSAAGRLFDAAAALTGLCTHASFEGQGPMLLEAACSNLGTPMNLHVARDDTGVVRLDWAPLLPMLMDSRRPVGDRAADFHASLAQAIAGIAVSLRGPRGFDGVGLSGGVFQNRRLAEATLTALAAVGLPAFLPARVPANDGGIAFGQVIEAAARDR